MMPRRKPPPSSPPLPPTPPLKDLADGVPLFPEITYPRKRAFLTAYVCCGSRQQAAKMIGVDPRNHWWWLSKDPAYAEAFARAERLAGDVAEDRVLELALEGYEEGVWYQGRRVGTQR